MKNTFKFEFHILYYLIGFFCLMTGYFKDFIWISLLIVVHECGHVTGAILWNWKIDRVIILPFGGMTVLKEKLNRPIGQEWWIVLLGPCYQMAFYGLLECLHMTNPTFTMYHFLLLGFNLLPILPLDGSRMIQLFFEMLCPYYHAKYMGLYVSILGLVGLSLYAITSCNPLLGLILCFLIKENWTYGKQIPYQMERFLLERYLNPFVSRHKKILHTNHVQGMKRGYQHIWIQNGTWKTEVEILDQYFHKTLHLIDKYRFL